METQQKTRYEVTLLGQNFTLRSERDASYVKALANFVTQELEGMRQATKAVSTHHVALLTSMNLADKLFRREEELEALRKMLKTTATNALHNVEKTLKTLPPEHRPEA